MKENNLFLFIIMDNYYQQNKDILKDKARDYYKKNRELILNKKKDYYKKNRIAKLEYQNNYNNIILNTEDGKKKQLIKNWKHIGLISDDYNAVYDKYINTNECELCEISITRGKGLIGKKHLDHDHKTGLFRNILYGKCNIHLKDI